jgi:hypothetical protein
MARSLGDPRPTEAPISEQDRKTLALVRRDIWINGFRGYVQGSLSALVLHSVGQFYETKFHAPKAGIYYVKKLNRNTALASFFLGGALGSFLMATVTGKNEVHNLHPIYTRQRHVGNNDAVEDDHETELTRRERNRILRRETLEVSVVVLSLYILVFFLVVVHLQIIIHLFCICYFFYGTQRLYNICSSSRHKQKQMELGHGGLSDSHGGHWIHEDDSVFKQNDNEK